MGVGQMTVAFDKIKRGCLVKITNMTRKRPVLKFGAVTFVNSDTFYYKNGRNEYVMWQARQDEAEGRIKLEILSEAPEWIQGWRLENGDVIDAHGNYLGNFVKGKSDV